MSVSGIHVLAHVYDAVLLLAGDQVGDAARTGLRTSTGRTRRRSAVVVIGVESVELDVCHTDNVQHLADTGRIPPPHFRARVG